VSVPDVPVTFPEPRDDAPLVVFDFDHTLYDGDSGSHLFKWLIQRAWWRQLLALLAAPVAGPMVAFLPTRRAGISVFVWIGTVGLHRRRDLDALIDDYVASHVDAIKARLLPIALEVFRAHREAGDRVVVATGAPPELAREILAFVAHQDVPVVGTLVGPKFGAVAAIRHCHHRMKMTMLRDAGYTRPVAIAYTDSSADLPLLQAAANPVVVNPKPGSVAMFRKTLPAGTPILNWGCPGRAGDPVSA
jgi:phosphatidylglycerophosphatase C